MLVNNLSMNIHDKEKQIGEMFAETYHNLPDIGD